MLEFFVIVVTLAVAIPITVRNAVIMGTFGFLRAYHRFYETHNEEPSDGPPNSTNEVKRNG